MAQLKIKTKRNIWKVHTHPRNIIGKGAYGIIYKGTDDKGREIAAKSFLEDKQSKMVKEDLEKLLNINHHNIVTIYDINAATDNTGLWMFMEFCKHGDLNRFLQSRNLTNSQLVDAMVQITQGLEYLHRHNIIHRDIKPANILIKEEAPLNLKLTDFDLSRFFDPDILTSVMSSNVGTLAFKAPEFFQRDKNGKLNYHRSVDMYALGLTFLAMIQRNKLLIPRIETPQDDDELHNPIGSTIANRMKYGIKELNVVKPSDITMSSTCHNVSCTSGTSTAAENDKFSNAILISCLKMLILKMTCAKPEERASVAVVLKTLLKKRLRDVNMWKSEVTGISAASTDPHTLLKRGKVDGHECLRVMNRTNGEVMGDIKGLCNHDPGFLVSCPNNSCNICEFCARCNEIRVYDTRNVANRRVICKKCTPRGMCSGRDNSLFVIDSLSVIWLCEWNCGDKNLKVIRKIQTKLPYLGGLIKMRHSVKNNSLIVVNISASVNAVSLVDGSCLWTLPRSIGGLEIHPYGVCCNLADGCILICNGQGEPRVLMLDPFTGHILQFIHVSDAFTYLSDLCWSDSQPHLTVLGTNEEGTDIIACFNVEDDV